MRVCGFRVHGFRKPEALTPNPEKALIPSCVSGIGRAQGCAVKGFRASKFGNTVRFESLPSLQIDVSPGAVKREALLGVGWRKLLLKT